MAEITEIRTDDEVIWVAKPEKLKEHFYLFRLRLMGLTYKAKITRADGSKWTGYVFTPRDENQLRRALTRKSGI
jgi:hypothetical protein